MTDMEELLPKLSYQHKIETNVNHVPIKDSSTVTITKASSAVIKSLRKLPLVFGRTILFLQNENVEDSGSYYLIHNDVSTLTYNNL